MKTRTLSLSDYRIATLTADTNYQSITNSKTLNFIVVSFQRRRQDYEPRGAMASAYSASL